MIKKVLIIIILLSISCINKKNTYNNLVTELIPTQSNLIIKFHNINKITQKLMQMKWWPEIKKTKITIYFITK